MLLKDKTAILYGGGGPIGATVARAFATEGAHVFLCGRTLSKLDEVAGSIGPSTGRAETAAVDATQPQSVEEHFAAIVQQTGGVDISFNMIGLVGQVGDNYDVSPALDAPGCVAVSSK